MKDLDLGAVEVLMRSERVIARSNSLKREA